ncbi:DNA mismatch repair protein MSH7 [Aristolochia californica]|uniref:DNA mismatch repair protein MSH7 n=1 Tax=Aristolochia californica TaxID=171875 RepID=UPI0035E00E86
MQRQKSILSFFKKPSQDGQNGGADSYSQMLHNRRPPSFPVNQQKHGEESVDPRAENLLPELMGTDTPPAKPQRQVLLLSSPVDNDAGARPFSNIMEKFRRKDEQGRFLERNQDKSSSFICSSDNELDGAQGVLAQGNSLSQTLTADGLKFDLSFELGASLDFVNITDDILGPDTPAMKPLVPRLKRVQEDSCKYGEKVYCPLPDSNKRMKSFHNPGTEKKNDVKLSENMSSKFEWLSPSLIKDANGRRPGDTLYDKKTLYIPPDALKKMSASQKQYWSTKCQYMDLVLFFKVGKFYELYEVDAEIGQKELDWRMTYSGVGKCRQVGISESGIDDAVQKLLARGYKVGRIEQVETSGQAKARGAASVIQRKLVHVYTPSTAVNGTMGPDAVHLLALKEGNGLETGSTIYGFAFLDYASSKFWVGSICDDASCVGLGALLLQVSPKEVIFEGRGLSAESQKALRKYALAGSIGVQLTPVIPGTDFMDHISVRELIQTKGYFRGSSDSWASVCGDVDHNDLTLSALGALLAHLTRLMLDDVICNGDISPYQVYENCLCMDGQTLMNLEIFSNNADGGSSGTLYNYLDNCITSSGKRLLRNWICHPLKDIGQINHRLNVVEGFMKHSDVFLFMAQYLRRLPDLERLLGQVKASVGSSAILLLPLVGERILKQRVKAFVSLVKGLRIGMDLLNIMQKEALQISSLSEVLNLPLLTGSNGLDEVLTQLEVAVDSDFAPHKDYVVKESDAVTLAILVELFAGKVPQWSKIIYAISRIDVLRSFAVTANSSVGSMCRPVILSHDSNSEVSCHEHGGSFLKTKGLWHPYAVADSGGGLVPNDLYLGENANGHSPRALLLTGPNMGGKSTLLRASCLAVILSQLGCYVPSEMCILTPVDTVFTRIGATDKIMTGESTFFIECMETASILQRATKNSLVVLDELGRGTSTFDGYAIAYAVFRHLIEKVHCRLLFATHYHPLAKEFASYPHVDLQHMACAFKQNSGITSNRDQELVFLYRLSPGACPESYGLQVALMAGVPELVVKAASKASQAMKVSLRENFRSSESRSQFSSLHEDWFKTLLSFSSITANPSLNEDALDTLLCLWHEIRGQSRAAL